MRGASELASGRANGPVLTSRFLTVLILLQVLYHCTMWSFLLFYFIILLFVSMINGVCKAKLSQALRNCDIVMAISVYYVMYRNWTIFSDLDTCHSAPDSPALRPSLLVTLPSLTHSTGTLLSPSPVITHHPTLSHPFN